MSFCPIIVDAEYVQLVEEAPSQFLHYKVSHVFICN